MVFGHHKHAQYVEASYQFNPQKEGDLQIKPGDKIEVLEKCSPDWYRGKCDGREGMFPANYVKPAFSDEDVDRPAAPPPRQESEKTEEKQSQPQQQQQQQQPQAQPMVVEQKKHHGRHRLSKFGKKLGNATIFGAGATMGSNLVNSIL